MDKWIKSSITRIHLFYCWGMKYFLSIPGLKYCKGILGWNGWGSVNKFYLMYE